MDVDVEIVKGCISTPIKMGGLQFPAMTSSLRCLWRRPQWLENFLDVMFRGVWFGMIPTLGDV